MNNLIRIGNTPIRQDNEGRYCLNDLHKASGGLAKDKPAKWTRLSAFKALVKEITGCPHLDIPAMKTVKGNYAYQGTFVVKELVYAYAMWISPKFSLQVIQAYDQMVTQPVQPAQPALPNFNNPVEAARAWADSIEDKLKAEQQLLEVKPKVERYDVVINSEGNHKITDAAAYLEIASANKLNKILKELGWLDKRTKQGNASVIGVASANKWMVTKNRTNSTNKMTFPQNYITPLGLDKLLDLKDQGSLPLI